MVLQREPASAVLWGTGDLLGPLEALLDCSLQGTTMHRVIQQEGNILPHGSFHFVVHSQWGGGKRWWSLMHYFNFTSWAELEMMSRDRSEVFSIAGSYFYLFLTTFSCLNL